MQSVVEVVCGGNTGSIGSCSGGKIYNTIYTDPGYCKMVIVQDDEKFPSPRLCLLRKWPNFEGGFGFHLYEDLLNSTGALKIENVIRGSPAEAGGLRANDVIIEINGDNIEYKSFFRLIEILKDAFSQHEMELLVLAELDAEWYRARNISVNSNFPNIEYCETPYYGHKFKPLDLPTTQSPQQPQQQQQQQQTGSSHIRINNPQIEFHSNTGKLFRTTLVIDKNKDTVYRRIEELPNSNEHQQQQHQQQQQDDVQPLRVYYRKGYGGLQEEALHTMIDSGHGSLSARRSTPISTTTVGSPYSTIGKSCGEQVAVDLLHDKWAELMDKYLDNRFRSSEDYQQDQQQQQHQQQGSISKKSHVIMLNNENYESTKRSRSAHATTSDYNSSGGSFSFLFSGRDDYQKRSQSPQPYHYHRQSIPQTRHNMSSPTRSTTPNRSKDRANSNERTEQSKRESSSSPYRTAAPHSIILRPKVLSQSLGFQLDENELIRNNCYYVKYVEGGSASSMAGLKDGDKITKINGKSTSGMSYDEFCNEILIAQQQQQQNKHNMIHLMVMRKSNKSALQQGSSITATAAANTSNITTSTKPTVSFNTSFNNNNNTTTIPINSTSSNLVSVVKVTSPTTPSSALFVDDKPVRGGISPASNKPNVIYTHEHIKEESSHSYSSTVQYGSSTIQQIPTTDKYSIPSATLATQPQQTVPTAVLATQPQTSVPSATLATQPPTSVKNPLSILTKVSILADKEKVDEKKPEPTVLKQQEIQSSSIIKVEATPVVPAATLAIQPSTSSVQNPNSNLVPTAILAAQPPKTQEIPPSSIAQIEPSVPTATLATQPPTSSVKNPLSILTKFSILADREKADEKKPVHEATSVTTINIEKEPVKEIKIEREQPTNIPITKPVVVEENVVVSQTIISTIQETNNVSQQEIITPPKVEREPTDYTDHEPIKPIEGTTINSQIDEVNLTESIPTPSKPVPSKILEEPVKPEQAISIPTLVVSSINGKPSEYANSIKSKLKSYHIDRNPEYFGFGIILHTDKEKEQDGETLSYPCLEIEKNSPADVSGLKNGQRLIAVNNEFINREFKSINSLAQAIDDCYYQRGSTDFLVLDEEVWESIKTEQTIINSLTTITTTELHEVQTHEQIVSLKPKDETSLINSSTIQNDKIVPRFCRLQRETREDQYGFDFKTLKSEGKHIATNVRDGYPAQKAGLRNGDYILEVNGRSIEGIEHEAVVNLIFSNIKQVDLLVVEDLKGYKKVRKQQEKLMQEVTTSSTTKLDSSNRHRIHLLPTYKGIGLHLNYDGVINYIEPSSPAELAGLRKDQKIVEVNEINVRGKTNREIASIIRENMNDLIIEVENTNQTSKENVIDALTVEQHPQQSIKPKDSVIKTLIESNVINPQPTSLSERSPAQPQKIRPVDENIFMQSKPVSDIGLNLPAASSPNLSISKGKSSSNNKLASSGGLKKNIKNKFGSCLGLNTESNKSNINDLIDDPNSIRVCNLVSRSDFLGYGFSLRKNEVGPHQIANVELNSPALLSGLQDDDYLLKINDINVVGERYSKTVTRIKNESDKGILKLEVVETTKISKDVRETRIDTQSGFASVSSVGKLSPIMSSSAKPSKKQRKDSKEIDPAMFSGSVRSVPEYMSITPSTSKRPSSASPNNAFDGISSQQQNRPFSMNDLDNIDPKSTVKSYDSATTGFSAGALNLSGNITSGSVRSVPNLPYTTKNTPKFKRCTVIAISNFKGFGFTINSQVKPKYMIHDVDKNSPAEFAGLRQNDVIIEINNKNIRRTSFEKVRMMLSDAYIVGKVEVLVISKEGYTWFKQKKKRFSNSTKLTNENNVELFSNVDRMNEIQTTSTGITSEQINAGSRISITNLNQSITSPYSTVNDNILPSLEQEDREIFTTILRRREDYQGFGISLATNKNAAKDEKLNVPIITNVETTSPGESADLRKNDFILEINNQSTYKQSSEAIANLIRNNGNEVKMVVSRERAPKATSDVNIGEQQSFELARLAIAAASISAIKSQNNQALHKDGDEQIPEIIVRRISRASMNDNKTSKRSRSESPNIISSAMTLSSSKIHLDSPNETRTRNLSEPPSILPNDAPVPRLCRVRTYEPNLGFVVAGSKTKSGIFKITDIAPNSPAFNSGLRNEDYIIEVSGVAVEKLKYEEIVNLIKTKQAEDDLQLLVADRKTLEWYKSRDTEISSRFVPKLTYIETLLQEELQFNLTEQLTNTTSRLSQESLTALEKIATNSKFVKKVTSSEHGETSYIIRKVYL